jgi:hypothetical protein
VLQDDQTVVEVLDHITEAGDGNNSTHEVRL